MLFERFKRLYTYTQKTKETKSKYRIMNKKPSELTIKSRTNPLLDTLPPYLKDPANYEKIRKVIYDTFTGSCSSGHGDMMEWAGCAKCQQRFSERSVVMKKLGFQSPAQYLAWQKTHEHIKTLDPKYVLPKYNSL